MVAEETTTTATTAASAPAERNPPSRSWSFRLPSEDGSNRSDAVDDPTDRPLSEADRNLQQSSQIPFYKFVLTGGPCGGKTTGLARVYSFLKERGKAGPTEGPAFFPMNFSSFSHFLNCSKNQGSKWSMSAKRLRFWPAMVCRLTSSPLTGWTLSSNTL